jgi:hypothetical protein
MASGMPSTNTHPLPVGSVRRTLVVTPSWRDAMTEPLVMGARKTPTTARRHESSPPRERHGPVRAGEIGPVRREIIFEPVEEPARPAPAPVEPAPAAPEAPPREPVPARP